MSQRRPTRPPVQAFHMDYLDLVLKEQSERDTRQPQSPEAEFDDVVAWPTSSSSFRWSGPEPSEKP